MAPTIEKRGRRPKPGARYPSGGLKPAMNTPTLQEIADARDRARRETEAETMATALAQPHRRGNPEPWLGSALGRFCHFQRVRRELYDAGLEYGAIIRRWRSAKGIPSDERHGTGGCGDGPSAATVAGWERQIAACEKELWTTRGMDAYRAVRQLVLFDADLPEIDNKPAIIGLQAIARALGLASPEHPYLTNRSGCG